MLQVSTIMKQSPSAPKSFRGSVRCIRMAIFGMCLREHCGTLRAVSLHTQARVCLCMRTFLDVGKRAALSLVDDISRIERALTPTPQTAEMLAKAVGISPEIAWHICTHLSGTRRAVCASGSMPSQDTFCQTN